MPGCHRNNDARYCGALTIVTNQSTVYVNNELWAVHGDRDTHITGDLIAAYGPKTANVEIENIKVICAPGDHAQTEPVPPYHPPPATWPKQASTDTYVYTGAGGG